MNYLKSALPLACIFLSLFISIPLIASAKFTPMKKNNNYYFFGDKQMNEILTFLKAHQGFYFFDSYNASESGQLNFHYNSRTKSKSVIYIEMLSLNKSKELQLRVPLTYFVQGNFDQNHTRKCLVDFGSFTDIDPAALARLPIIFNQYFPKKIVYKDYAAHIFASSLGKAGKWPKFLKYVNSLPSYTQQLAIYFQLSQKWRLMLFVNKQKGKFNYNEIYYRLTNYSGDEQFLINLNKSKSSQ